MDRKILRRFAEGEYSQDTTEMVHGWMLENEAVSESAMHDLWSRLDAKQERTVKSRLFVFSRRAAAVLLIAVSLISTYLAIAEKDVQTNLVECYCPVAEMKNIVLPDGTAVTLNAHTILLYPDEFRGDTRSVYLSGEAYFDVAEDTKHPFIVKSNDFQVTALGTEFNVTAYPEDKSVSATLVEGTVKIECNNLTSAIILSPNQQLIYDKESKSVNMITPDVDDIVAWIEGDLVFSNNTLEEIFDRMELRFGYEIVYASDKDSDETYSFRFRDGLSFPEVLDIITQVSGTVSYKIDGTKCYITH